MAHASSAVVVLTTLGADADAGAFATMLVSEGLAACVNVLPAVQSVYRWKGATHADREQQLVLKTTREALPQLEARLHALHPYELPEFLVLDAGGSRAYLDWLASSVGDDATRG